MTRILLISLYYEPDATGIGPYTTKVAEHLATQRYDVTAITGMPHYPAWRVHDAYRGKLSMRETRNGVDVRRQRHYVPSRHGALHRALYEASFLASALPALHIEPPHAVIGIVPSLGGGAFARIAASRHRAPYGIVFQDLVGQAAGQSGIAGGRRVARVARAAEAWASHAASAVGIVSEGFRPYVESLGVTPSRIRRLRNWTQVAPPAIERDEMRARLGWPREATVCLHAGNIGVKQGLENVIHCARLAQSEDPGMLFALMGDGSARQALEAMAARYGARNVRFLPLQPAAAVSSVLSAADVLLVNQRGSVIDMALPSKLTSYFAAGRPIVAAATAGSETSREVTYSGGGIVCTPDDPLALLAALRRAAHDTGLREHLSRNTRDWAATTLSEPAALRGYEQFVAAVLAAGSRGRVHAPVHAQHALESGRDRWIA